MGFAKTNHSFSIPMATPPSVAVPPAVHSRPLIAAFAELDPERADTLTITYEQLVDCGVCGHSEYCADHLVYDAKGNKYTIEHCDDGFLILDCDAQVTLEGWWKDVYPKLRLSNLERVPPPGTVRLDTANFYQMAVNISKRRVADASRPISSLRPLCRK